MAESSMLLIAAAAAALVGLAWLALGMDVHWAQVHGDAATPPSTRLRWGGACALALSFVLCLKVDHATMAVLVWVMLLAGSAVGVAMTLSTRPHWLRAFWPAASR